jgi:hypothetical protein
MIAAVIVDGERPGTRRPMLVAHVGFSNFLAADVLAADSDSASRKR